MRRTLTGAVSVLVVSATALLGSPGSVAPASAASTATVAPQCGGQAPAKPTGGTWRCTFSDEFTARELDTSTWTVTDTATTGFRMSNTCFDARSNNVRQRNGALELLATRHWPFNCKSPLGQFQTRYKGGSVSSAGKFHQAYGRWEARIQFGNDTPGLHANFWLNPKDKVYGAWPKSGEIDIAEWFSAAGQAFPTLHYAGSTTADTGRGCVLGSPEVFHTFALEWSSTTMRFLYDGKLCFTRSWTPTNVVAPAPFNRPFYISLTNGVGSSWNAPTTATKLASTMRVDYVRVWS